MNDLRIITHVPLEAADAVRMAIGDAGAGHEGEYTHCSFTMRGQGRATPTDKANPYKGQANQPELLEEEHIEVTCTRDLAGKVIAAIRAAHPYEEVPIYVHELIDPDSL